MALNIQRLNFDAATGDNPSEAFMKLDLDIGEIAEAIDGDGGIQATLDGLGNSSTKDVGTAAGTVAAGDDERFTNFHQVTSYWTGLGLSRAASNQVGVSSGAFYLPSEEGIIICPNAMTTPAITLAASTMYHVYGYNNASVPAVELSATAPSAAYFGTARTKAGDTSRRYLGSVRTDNAGAIIPFDHAAETGMYHYKSNINNNGQNPLAQGIATSPTTVALSAVLPPSAVRALLYLENQSSASLAFIGTPDIDPESIIINFVRAGSRLTSIAIVNSLQQINYVLNGTPVSGQGLSVWVLGYIFPR